jgi:carbon-monoxide dehydrogenase medium subunit
MKPATFEYWAPTTLHEALGILAREDGEAKVLAGGQSLVPAMNFRLATPAALVDINRIGGHDGVRVEGDHVTIGMLVRHRDLERSVVDDPLGELLAETANLVGHLPIRVRGTFAGSLAHADPAAEWSMLVVALEGSIVIRSAAGTRTIAAADFFEGPFMTALAPDEIITEVRLPLLGRAGTCVLEQSRTAGDFATVAALAILRLEGGVVAEAHLGIAGAEGRPVRLAAAEGALVGGAPERRTLDDAARVAGEQVDPISDNNASSDYRRHLVRVLVRRALEEAAVRAVP